MYTAILIIKNKTKFVVKNSPARASGFLVLAFAAFAPNHLFPFRFSIQALPLFLGKDLYVRHHLFLH